VTARVLLLGLAVALFTASPASADPAGDLLATDAPPPVPLGIIEGSASPVAPVAPRRSASSTVGRARSLKPRAPVEKPMDRYARIPRPQSRYRSGPTAAFGGGHGGGGPSCTRSR
jgi:hypothetical protein